MTERKKKASDTPSKLSRVKIHFEKLEKALEREYVKRKGLKG